MWAARLPLSQAGAQGSHTPSWADSDSRPDRQRSSPRSAFAPPTLAEGRELNKCIVCCLQCFKCFISCGAFCISLPVGVLVAIITIPVSVGLVVAGWHSLTAHSLLLLLLHA